KLRCTPRASTIAVVVLLVGGVRVESTDVAVTVGFRHFLRPGQALTSTDRRRVLDPAPPGGVAEWPRQGSAKPWTRVQFPPPPRRVVHETSAPSFMKPCRVACSTRSCD